MTRIDDTVTQSKWWTGCLYAVAFVLALLPGIGLAHEPYTDWRMPNSATPCCTPQRTNDDGTVTGDCRPVRARLGSDGIWEAWTEGRWLPVPPDRILKIPSPDGRSHLCEIAGTVLCFVPAPVHG